MTFPGAVSTEGPGIPLYREESKGEGWRGPLSGLSPGLGTTDHSSGPPAPGGNLTSFTSPLQTLCSSQPRLQTAPTQQTSLKSPALFLGLFLSSLSHAPNRLIFTLSPAAPAGGPARGHLGSSRGSDTAAHPRLASKPPPALRSCPTDFCSAAQSQNFRGGESSPLALLKPG